MKIHVLAAVAAAASIQLSIARADQGFSVTPTRVEVAGAPSERVRFTLTLAATGSEQVVVQLEPRDVVQSPDGSVHDIDPSPDLARAVAIRPARVALARGQPARVEVEVVALPRRGTRVLGLAATPVGASAARREGVQVALRFRYLVLAAVHSGSGAGRPALSLEDVRYDPHEGVVHGTLVSADAFERQARVEAALLPVAGGRAARVDVSPPARAGAPTFRVWPGARLALQGRLPCPPTGGPHLLRLSLESSGRRQEVRLRLDLPASGEPGGPRPTAGSVALVAGTPAMEVDAPAGAARARAAVVRNASAGAARVRAVLIEEGDPARSCSAWLELGGDERDLAPGASWRVAVVARVPAGTPAGEYVATLQVEPVDAEGAPVRIPVRVKVEGTP